MGRRTSGSSLLVLGCLLMAGCGASVVTRRAARARSEAPSQTAAQRCAKAARLTPEVAFPAWHMGAVHFLSVTSGVGITAQDFSCFGRARIGTSVGAQRQSVRLAVTSDGGRWWHVGGATLPVGPESGGVGSEQMIATSTADVWAIVGKGRLIATHDGGMHWQVQTIPKPVVAIATGARSLWAVSCPDAASRTFTFACRPELWRTRSGDHSWARVALPHVTAQGSFTVRFALTAKDMIVALTDASAHANGVLLSSDDAGLRWVMRRAPTWDHNKCDEAALAAHAPSTFWLLCLGGAAAGSSTKGLLRTTDAGRTWTTVSAVRSLVRRPRPGSIPLEEPGALAAGSRRRLWLSLINRLAESNDAGRRWTYPSVFNQDGAATALDVLDARHAWLLASGAGLWRTTGGLRWRVVGPLNTG
jgi:photosystem II stability/assembly factor-like uncharacterized protein